MTTEELTQIRDQHTKLIAIRHDTAIAIRKLLDDAREQFEAALGDVDDTWDEDEILEMVTGDSP